jgi:hypothetical protein
MIMVLLIRDEALEQLVKDLEGYLKSIKVGEGPQEQMAAFNSGWIRDQGSRFQLSDGTFHRKTAQPDIQHIGGSSELKTSGMSTLS